MTDNYDDDGAPAPGFVRATPELLAEQRAAWLLDTEHDLRRWMVLDVGLSGEALERNIGKAMTALAEKYDRESADWTAKVAANAKRGAAPLH